MIPYGKHYIDEDDIEAVVDVLRNGPITQGPKIEAFEEAIANYVGSKYAVCVSSGTAALHLSYLASGIKPGKAVVTSPITFVSTANAAKFCGGDIFFADIDSKTINLSLKSLEQVLEINDNIHVITPVHFGGMPCDMKAIKNLSDKFGAFVIEDAAHAFGATYQNGKKVGCCENSLMTIFSFHPVKSIAAGEGGAITTNDENIYRKLIKLRSHGINKLNDPFIYDHQSTEKGKKNPWYYEMQDLGYHYRLTDLQCALAMSLLNKIDRFIDRRRILARQYDNFFKDISNLSVIQKDGRSFSSHHLFVLRINFEEFHLTRSEFMEKLKTGGIGSQVHYIPLSRQPYYQQLGIKPEDYPNAENYYKEALSIPLFYGLSDYDQKKVVNKIFDILDM